MLGVRCAVDKLLVMKESSRPHGRKIDPVMEGIVLHAGDDLECIAIACIEFARQKRYRDAEVAFGWGYPCPTADWYEFSAIADDEVLPWLLHRVEGRVMLGRVDLLVKFNRDALDILFDHEGRTWIGCSEPADLVEIRRVVAGSVERDLGIREYRYDAPTTSQNVIEISQG